MKKTFELTHPKIKYARLVEGVKNDIRKYIKRERRRELPEGVDFWDFDCRFGDTEADARIVHLAEINDCINGIEKRELKSFYVEIIATSGIRAKSVAEGETKQPEEVVPVDPPKLAIPKMKTFGED
jgi:hypothetical protein